MSADVDVLDGRIDTVESQIANLVETLNNNFFPKRDLDRIRAELVQVKESLSILDGTEGDSEDAPFSYPESRVKELEETMAKVQSDIQTINQSIKLMQSSIASLVVKIDTHILGS